MTDKLRSDNSAHLELIPEEIHSAEQYKNNRAGQQLEMLAFDYLVPRKLICLNLDLDDA